MEEAASQAILSCMLPLLLYGVHRLCEVYTRLLMILLRLGWVLKSNFRSLLRKDRVGTGWGWKGYGQRVLSSFGDRVEFLE